VNEASPLVSPNQICAVTGDFGLALAFPHERLQINARIERVATRS
jgi:hypothetical protein